MGYLNYGSNNYWSSFPYNSNSILISDLPILLDSTQYNFDIINSIKNRRGLYIEADVLRTNFPNFIFHQNYIDLQFGLGLQYTDFSSNPSLPKTPGKEWDVKSSRGNYYFRPKSMGFNINSTIGWQIATNRISYIYHALGINSISLYESEGGDTDITGIGFSESFGIGTKYILNQSKNNFSYTFGLEIKWNRLYADNLNSSKGLSPIYGIDLRASGIFFTTGIHFGGKKTDGDIAYNYMINNDFISATENFEYFLAKERRHGKRQQALKMLRFCQSQIPYQQVNNGIQDVLQTNFNSAVSWFNTAEEEADSNLTISIQHQRLSIAEIIIDSVQNNINNISIQNSEKLIAIALELMPNNKRANKVLSKLYYDRGKLNIQIGNYNKALENFSYAIKLNNNLEPVVLIELEKLINIIIKDSYISASSGDLYLVLKHLKNIILLKPEIKDEWEHYISILEYKLINKENNYIKAHIKNLQINSTSNIASEIQLGMTSKEVEKIKGKPKIIDQINKSNQYFQMWTYYSNSNVIRLYFQNNKLIRIE